jgi:hypothetical protein
VKRRTVFAIAALWIALVGAGSTVTWFVIDSAGSHVLAGPTPGPRPTQDNIDVVQTPLSAASDSPTRRPVRHHKHPPRRVTSPTTASQPTVEPSPSVAPAPPRSTHHVSTAMPSPAAPKSRVRTRPLAPMRVTRTWRDTPGSVVASCTGVTVELQSATPADGYRVEVGSRGPHEVEVTFQLLDESSQTQVKAVCAHDAPRFSTEVESEHHRDTQASPSSAPPEH